MESDLYPYSPVQWRAVVANLEKVSGTPADQISLKQRLTGLFEAVGRSYGGDEYGKSFQEFADAEPDHSELAATFRALAQAGDPLDPTIYCGGVAAELNGAARSLWRSGGWPTSFNRSHPLRGVAGDHLTEEERETVRRLATQLADRHASFVQAGAPPKFDQDTILEGLADIFLEFTRSDAGRYDLPHAQNSAFIRFVHAAVQPFFGSTEMSPSAIAKRWKRLKDRAAKGRP